MNTEDLLTMQTDALLEMSQSWREQGQRLIGLANQAEWEVLRRLHELGATVHASEHYEAKVVPGKKAYNYHLERLAELKPLLRDGEWDVLVTEKTVTDVDKTLLNKLAKRGGEVARIIGEATVTMQGDDRLSIKRLEEER